MTKGSDSDGPPEPGTKPETKTEHEAAPSSPGAADEGERLADVVPITRARDLAEEKGAPTEAEAHTEAPTEAPPESPPAGESKFGAFLTPVMQAIAKELSGLADADGVLRLGDDPEANRKKSAAVLKGLGQGLGTAIEQALRSWGVKIETGKAGPEKSAAPVEPATAQPEPPGAGAVEEPASPPKDDEPGR